MSPTSSSKTRSALPQIQLNCNSVVTASNIARTDMTFCDCENELHKAETNSTEAIAALEGLVKGIQAVKRILERPVDSKEHGNSGCAFESRDANIVSNLSEKLVGILGSELLGLLNAALMAKEHAKLRIQDERNVIQDLHHASEFANSLNDQVEKAERRSHRLKAEKKLLVKEVRSLREDCHFLLKEVKSLHKIVQCTKQFDEWRLLEEHVRAAVTVHESVLSNKTFQSGFAAGTDPPGIKVTKDIDVEDKCKDTLENHTSIISVSEKKINAQHTHFPRKVTQGYEAGNNIDNALKYTKDTQKQVKSIFKVIPSPKSTCNPTASKKRGLPFRTGLSNSLTSGLGRFKNVLQEASDPKRHHEECNVEAVSHYEKYDRKGTSIRCQHQSQTNVEKNFLKSKGNESDKENDENNNSMIPNCMILDDDATKSTKSCSFEMETMNLSSSVTDCSDDGMTNDLALQISIDDGSSLLDNGSPDGFVCTSFSPPPLMITPDASPIARQSTKVVLKPRCSPNILRTLAVPNVNTVRGTISSPEAL